MSFCGKCGQELKPQAKFCGRCGQSLDGNDGRDRQEIIFEHREELEEEQVEEQRKEEKEDWGEEQWEDVEFTDSVDTRIQVYQPELASRRSLSKRSKIVIGIVGIIAILVSALWYIGNTITKPSEMIQSFNAAVSSNDKKKISDLIYCNDSKLKISEKSIEPLIQYLKDNPSYSKDMIEQLRKDALALDADRGLVSIINSKSPSPFTIVESGKKYLFFSNYKIAVKPIYFDVSTDIKDVSFSLNNQVIGKSDVDGFSREYGPFVPGKYELESSYSGKYGSLVDKKYIDSISTTDEKIKIKVFDTLKYVKISSNYSDAEIYVNNKDTGVKVSDAQNFGPLSKGTSVYGIVNKNGKMIKSSMYSVTESDSEIYLDFQESESEIRAIEKQLYTLVNNYVHGFSSAVNNGDLYYVEPYIYPGSQLYNEQKKYVPSTYQKGIREEIMSFTISSYTVSDDNQSGVINTEEVYNVQKDGESSVRTFRCKYNFRYNYSESCYQLSSIDTTAE